MAFGKMAPQAYTKEILQEAFEWWSEQPEELRNRIQDSDDLVGYYLRVKRSEGGSDNNILEHHEDSFSRELKGLAADLSSFEGYQSSKKKSKKEPVNPINTAAVQSKAPSRPAKPAGNSPQLQFPQLSKKVVQPEAEVKPESTPLPGEEPKAGSLVLDARSLEMVKKARESLNLSSDYEALRALISFGSQKLQLLFKEKSK